MKKSNILAFQRYKIFHSNLRNDKVMVETKKLAERGGLFFVPNCICACFCIFFSLATDIHQPIILSNNKMININFQFLN